MVDRWTEVRTRAPEGRRRRLREIMKNIERAISAALSAKNEALAVVLVNALTFGAY